MSCGRWESPLFQAQCCFLATRSQDLGAPQNSPTVVIPSLERVCFCTFIYLSVYFACILHYSSQHHKWTDGSMSVEQNKDLFRWLCECTQCCGIVILDLLLERFPVTLAFVWCLKHWSNLAQSCEDSSHNIAFLRSRSWNLFSSWPSGFNVRSVLRL